LVVPFLPFLFWGQYKSRRSLLFPPPPLCLVLLMVFVWEIFPFRGTSCFCGFPLPPFLRGLLAHYVPSLFLFLRLKRLGAQVVTDFLSPSLGVPPFLFPNPSPFFPGPPQTPTLFFSFPFLFLFRPPSPPTPKRGGVVGGGLFVGPPFHFCSPPLQVVKQGTGPVFPFFFVFFFLFLSTPPPTLPWGFLPFFFWKSVPPLISPCGLELEVFVDWGKFLGTQHQFALFFGAIRLHFFARQLPPHRRFTRSNPHRFLFVLFLYFLLFFSPAL